LNTTPHHPHNPATHQSSIAWHLGSARISMDRMRRDVARGDVHKVANHETNIRVAHMCACDSAQKVAELIGLEFSRI